MSNQVEEALRKAVEHAKRAGALMPTGEREAAEHEALAEESARNGRTFDIPSRPA